MKIETLELKECPICKGTDTLVCKENDDEFEINGAPYGIRVHCSELHNGCGWSGPTRIDLIKAIRAWNER